MQEASEGKGYYGTTEAWAVTNNTFTKNACNYAERLNVKLVDRKDLIHLISESKAVAKPQETRPV
ncbi:Restriction endonuclease [compost metagenome]